MTPRMTRHARDRCVEMGISTKVAKRIVQNPTVTHTTNGGQNRHKPHEGGDRVVATSTAYPDYAVVYAVEKDVTWVITVLFNTQVRYTRNGATYKEEASEAEG